MQLLPAIGAVSVAIWAVVVVVIGAVVVVNDVAAAAIGAIAVVAIFVDTTGVVVVLIGPDAVVFIASVVVVIDVGFDAAIDAVVAIYVAAAVVVIDAAATNTRKNFFPIFLSRFPRWKKEIGANPLIATILNKVCSALKLAYSNLTKTFRGEKCHSV